MAKEDNWKFIARRHKIRSLTKTVMITKRKILRNIIDLLSRQVPSALSFLFKDNFYAPTCVSFDSFDSFHSKFKRVMSSKISLSGGSSWRE